MEDQHLLRGLLPHDLRQRAPHRGLPRRRRCEPRQPGRLGGQDREHRRWRRPGRIVLPAVQQLGHPHGPTHLYRWRRGQRSHRRGRGRRRIARRHGQRPPRRRGRRRHLRHRCRGRWLGCDRRAHRVDGVRLDSPAAVCQPRPPEGGMVVSGRGPSLDRRGSRPGRHARCSAGARPAR